MGRTNRQPCKMSIYYRQDERAEPAHAIKQALPPREYEIRVDTVRRTRRDASPMQNHALSAGRMGSVPTHPDESSPCRRTPWTRSAG